MAQRTKGCGLRLSVLLIPVVFALLSGTSAPVRGDDNQVGIYLDFAGQDPLGKQLDFFLRERFRQSPTFREVFDPKQGAFVLHLTTIDPTFNNDGFSTSYSFAVTITNPAGFDYYVTSLVGVCGSQKLTDCATSLFGNVGSVLEEIRRSLAAAAAGSSSH